jgi:predicted nuclease of predicted toxin-antitoxin system
MRVLLDNNIPRRFKQSLKGLDVTHVLDVALAGLKDGPLLDTLVGRYDVLVTMDKSLRHQQNLSGRSFAIVLLRARSNKLRDIQSLEPQLRRQLPFCQPGQVYEVSA